MHWCILQAFLVRSPLFAARPLGWADGSGNLTLEKTLIDAEVLPVRRVDDLGCDLSHIPQQLLVVAARSHSGVVVDVISFDHCLPCRATESKDFSCRRDGVATGHGLLELRVHDVLFGRLPGNLHLCKQIAETKAKQAKHEDANGSDP